MPVAAWQATPDLGLFGAALVWQTTLHGVGLSPDSVAYVVGARWTLGG